MGKLNKTLFTDKFPKINSDTELARLQKKLHKYDPYYVTSGCVLERRRKLDKLWKKFHPFADSFFLKQYKLSFHDRTWEMYLGNILLINNLKIEPLDKGPDFFVDNSEYIECVICERGEKDLPNSVPELHFTEDPMDITVQDVPVDKMILRITSVIDCKYKKYLADNWEHIDKDKPFIIAINSGLLQHPQDYLGIPLIIKALFGIEHLKIGIGSGNTSFSFRSSLQKINSIKPIPIDLFTSETYKEISGIFFSDKTVINHPNNIGEDCIFINNPFAKNPVNFEKYSFFKHWHADKKGKITKLY